METVLPHARVCPSQCGLCLRHALLSLLWGSSYPAIKNGYELFLIATDDIPSKVVFAGYRFLFAGVLLLLFALAQRKPIARLTPAQFGQLTVLGRLWQTEQCITFFYIGLAYTTGVNGSIMNATGTFFSVLLAHFIYHNDKLSYNKTLGCILVCRSDAGELPQWAKRVPLCLEWRRVCGAGGIYPLCCHALRKTLSDGRPHGDDRMAAGYRRGDTGGRWLCHGGHAGAAPSVNALAVLGYLTLLSSVAFALWSMLLKVSRVSMIAPFNFVIPVAGTVLSAIFLGENILEIKYAVALVLVCSGIWWVNKRSH